MGYYSMVVTTQYSATRKGNQLHSTLAGIARAVESARKGWKLGWLFICQITQLELVLGLH